MAWRQSPGGSEQHLTRAAAAARTRTQRPGKRLAVHASELVVTGFSNPSTISSTTAATLGTYSSTNPGRLCPSRDATGQQSVTQSEDWYKNFAHPIRVRQGERPEQGRRAIAPSHCWPLR